MYGPRPSKNLKLTYLLRAGASFNSVPILNKQSSSMLSVGNLINKVVNSNQLQSGDELEKRLYKNNYLIWLSGRIINYAYKADEFGSIDTYARRLWLLRENKELHNLRECISIYFTLCYERLVLKKRKYLVLILNRLMDMGQLIKDT